MRMSHPLCVYIKCKYMYVCVCVSLNRFNSLSCVQVTLFSNVRYTHIYTRRECTWNGQCRFIKRTGEDVSQTHIHTQYLYIPMYGWVWVWLWFGIQTTSMSCAHVSPSITLGRTSSAISGGPQSLFVLARDWHPPPSSPSYYPLFSSLPPKISTTYMTFSANSASTNVLFFFLFSLWKYFFFLPQIFLKNFFYLSYVFFTYHKLI